MPIIHSDYPPELEQAITKAKSLHDLAWDSGPEKGAPNSGRMHTFSLLMTLVFEHQDSIVLLLGTGKNDGSAFALRRPLVEAFYRGIWTLSCATDTEVDQIRLGGEPYPKFFLQMTKAVDLQLGSIGLELNRTEWGSLNGFVHGGREQLSRRVNVDGDVIPNYPLAEKLQVLSSASIFMALMAQIFCSAACRTDDADHISKSLGEFCHVVS